MKKILIVVLIAWAIFHPVKASMALAPEPPPVKVQDLTVKELVQYYAKEYAVSAIILEKVMLCESGGNQKAIGDNGAAVGIFQFHKPTWEAFSKKLGEDLDRTSQIDQAKLAAFAFSEGLQSHWSCYTKLYGKKLAVTTS